MDNTILAALIVAVGALVGHWLIKFLEHRSKLREKRISLYTALLQSIQTSLEKSEHGAQFIRDASLTTRLVAWATPNVIIATTKVWQTAEAEKSREELLGAVAELLASIRKDFGHAEQVDPLFYKLAATLYVRKTAAQQIVGPERR